MPLPRGLHGFHTRLRFIFGRSTFGQSSDNVLKPHQSHRCSPFPFCNLQIGLTRFTTIARHTNPVWHVKTQPASTMTSNIQTRQHGGHAHAHHHHDNTYLTSTNSNDPGVRITRIGLIVNLFMAMGKGLGGYFLNSQALVADAFHSLTDLVSDFLTLATVAWSLKPPTPKFPSGYGKIESLGSLGVSSLLLAGGIGLGWHSVEILFSQLFLDAASTIAEHNHNHGHDHGFGGGLFGGHSHNPADMGIPNVHAAWIAGSSIIIKEYLYRASKSSF